MSHCKFLHGYSLGFEFVFASENLNLHGWVYDFGSCSWIKDFLIEHLDHKVILQNDDPELDKFEELAESNLIQLVFVKNSSCEGFAKMVFESVNQGLVIATDSKVWLKKATVFEHNTNSASFQV